MRLSDYFSKIETLSRIIKGQKKENQAFPRPSSESNYTSVSIFLFPGEVIGVS